MPTLIDLNPDKFYHCSFIVTLYRCYRSRNIGEDLFDSVYFPSKREDVKLKVFNTIKGIKESKTLTKHISYEFKCEFDCRKWNSRQKWNNDRCQCESKKPIKHHACVYDSDIDFKIGKYLKDCECVKILLKI